MISDEAVEMAETFFKFNAEHINEHRKHLREAVCAHEFSFMRKSKAFLASSA